MALTHTSWVDYEWDGVAGTNDWSTPETIQYSPHQPFTESLRLAAIERWTATEITYRESVITGLEDAEAVAGELLSYGGSLYPAIWDDDLIESFVDYRTAVSGKWDNVDDAAFAPSWTKTNLLTDIGYAEAIPFEDAHKAEWAKFLYEVLIRLIWRKPSMTAPKAANAYWRNAGFDGGDNFTYAEAVAKWDISAWNDYGTTRPNDCFSDFRDPASTVRLHREAPSWRSNTAVPTQRDTDVYLWSETAKNFWPPATNVYDTTSLPYTLTEDKWRFWETPAQEDPPYFQTEPLGKIDSAPPIDPPVYSRHGCQFSAQFVYRFNVAGGFIFGDGA